MQCHYFYTIIFGIIGRHEKHGRGPNANVDSSVDFGKRVDFRQADDELGAQNDCLT